MVPHWYSPTVAAILHVASLGFALVVAERSIRDARRTGVRRDLLRSITGLRPPEIEVRAQEEHVVE
jgi:hypothetical protein